MKILWVEDHIEDNRALQDRVLECQGDVLTAANLQLALRILETHGRFDRYIIDLKIPLGPDIEGYEDTDYNGTYILDRLKEKGVALKHIVCLSNFSLEASGLVKKFGVRTINKGAFHTELIDALGLTSPRSSAGEQ